MDAAIGYDQNSPLYVLLNTSAEMILHLTTRHEIFSSQPVPTLNESESNSELKELESPKDPFE